MPIWGYYEDSMNIKKKKAMLREVYIGSEM